MPSAFENDLQDLAKRFAHDLVARARRASLAELAQALGAKAPSSWERRYGLTEAQSFKPRHRRRWSRFLIQTPQT